MQVSLGGETATMELPDQMAAWPREKLQDFFAEHVPQMVIELRQRRRDRINDVAKKAKE